MNISLDKAEILALFLETFLYGIFFTLYWISVIVLLHKGQAGYIQRRTLISVGSVMLVLSTAHLIIDFLRAVIAFTHTSEGGANEYYSNLASPLETAKTVIYITLTILGDSVLIWRCYVVNMRSIWVAIPYGVLLAVNTAVGYIIAWSLSQAGPDQSVFQTGTHWILTFFTLTMFTNATCTVGIAWRIYYTRQFVKGIANLLPISIVIMESGALYTSSILAVLIAYVTGSNGQYPALDVCAPVVGIAFSLITLQIRFHLGGSGTPSSDFGVSTARSFPSALRTQWRRHSARSEESKDMQILSYPMQPMTVHITEQTEIGDPEGGAHLRMMGEEFGYSHSFDPDVKPVDVR
ncbi:hypothetical protein SERLA73DRAFT_189063 [Serpula lacrymans var. lacrymans S7.3]|uniref:Uncharacterized protein n=1 Tax=Serpula lacrymans var. lacrymans (strain S7.3) TaxID=936435 RepID=F8QCR5_SERL3|nr:hypothetical protein SERLA73DRAFT_189063 [Serpula lacrymans var. lacrymans S7.3]